MTPKKVWRFILLFVVTYTILFIPATGFRKFYSNALRITGDKIFKHFGDEGIVAIAAQKKDATVLDVYISKTGMQEGGNFKGGKYDFNIIASGLFLAAVFFISLVVAVPLSWSRKIIALIFGFIVILFCAMLKLRIYILHYYAINPWIGLYQEDKKKESIDFWYTYFAKQESADFTFVIIIWVLLCVRKKEWQQLNGAFSDTVIKKKPATGKKLAKK